MEETTAGDSLHKPPPTTYIPSDILCRLPVKSLLRFRCICMSWNALISEDTNKFAMKHLLLSPKRQHLVTTSWKVGKEISVMSCPFNSLNLCSTFTSESTLLDYSPFVSNHCDGLIASCDGLLCFAIDQRRLAVLYNPSIRKLNILPYIVHPPGHVSNHQYAFGYDPFIHNYKVIAVSHYYDRNLATRFRFIVHSYTLGNKSWDRIEDFPSEFHLTTKSLIHGVFVSGTVNWLTCHHSNHNDAIVSLHLGKESYQEIPPPDNGKQYKLNLDVIRDCLCLISQESRGSINIWVMKEYGKKESWIKFVRLPCFSNLISHSEFTQLVYISDNNNHVLFVYRNVWNSKWVAFVYDIKKDTIKSYKIEDNVSVVKSKVYVESLISP